MVRTAPTGTPGRFSAFRSLECPFLCVSSRRSSAARSRATTATTRSPSRRSCIGTTPPAHALRGPPPGRLALSPPGARGRRRRVGLYPRAAATAPQRLSDDALLARERALIAAATSIAERHIRALEVERVLGADSEKAARILASTTRTLGELGRRSLDCQERAAKRKRARAERFHDLTPARSPAEVREDFTRRLVEYCRGRVPGLDAP